MNFTVVINRVYIYSIKHSYKKQIKIQNDKRDSIICCMCLSMPISVGKSLCMRDNPKPIKYNEHELQR